MPSDNSVKAALSLIEKDTSKVLGLSVGKHTGVKSGQLIPRADAQAPPELRIASLSPTGIYIVVCLDLDAPFPSFGVLGPILHWIQPGLKAEPDAYGTGLFTLKSTNPFVANYLGPAPPPGSSLQRYIFLLYEQPAEFDGAKHASAGEKKLGSMQRVRYDLDAWAKTTKLGPVLAANYFKSN